jgi:hypothetical protein
MCEETFKVNEDISLELACSVSNFVCMYDATTMSQSTSSIASFFLLAFSFKMNDHYYCYSRFISNLTHPPFNSILQIKNDPLLRDLFLKMQD